MTYVDLDAFLTTGVFAFMLAMVRVGTMVMIMPGIGNTFVPGPIRLWFMVGFALVLLPMLQANIPQPLPKMPLMVLLILVEFTIGLFIGLVGRILMSALDTAGMIVSVQSSLANAQLFNPALQSQGTVVGTFMTLAGILMLFVTDLHHMLILGMVRSYEIFPLGQVPDMGSMTQVVVTSIDKSFAIGVTIAAPFLIIILVLYACMGVLAKLMPQIQIFMLAVPVQLVLALMTFAMVISGMLLYWLDQYQAGMNYVFAGGGR